MYPNYAPIRRHARVIEIADGHRIEMYEPGTLADGVALVRDRRRVWSSNAALIDPADAARAARRERIEG